MKTYALNDHAPPLTELVDQAKQGQKIVLTEKNRPVVRLVAVAAPRRLCPKAGTLKGKIRLSPDFDKPLDDFKEYME